MRVSPLAMLLDTFTIKSAILSLFIIPMERNR